MMQDGSNGRAKRYGLGILVAVLVTAVVSGGVVMWMRDPTDAAPKPAGTAKNPAPSMFSFTGSPDWWQGATNQTSMALFHTNSNDGCFVSAEYHPGTVDVTTELQKNQSILASGGYTVASTGTQIVALQTKAGPEQYQLVQYDVTGSSTVTAQVMGGQELGYVQLTGSYLKFTGYCNTVNQLRTTIPALQAIKFNRAV